MVAAQGKRKSKDRLPPVICDTPESVLKRVAYFRRKLADTPTIGPTPETAAKLRFDVLDRLFPVIETGSRKFEKRQDPELFRAGEEIRDVFEGITRSLFSRGIDPRNIKVDTSKRRMKQPIEAAPDYILEKYQDNYLPWSDEMGVIEQGPPGEGMSSLGVAIHVLVDGWTLAESDYVLRKRKGASRQVLMDCLQRYAEIAGWLENKY